jgi:hypothetical protein
MKDAESHSIAHAYRNSLLVIGAIYPWLLLRCFPMISLHSPMSGAENGAFPGIDGPFLPLIGGAYRKEYVLKGGAYDAAKPTAWRGLRPGPAFTLAKLC